MKHYYLTFLLLLTLNLSFAQTPVIPVSATTTYTEFLGTSLINGFNGSGLSVFPALTGDHATITPGNCFVADTVVGSVDFNLGGNYDIDGLSFWNLNGDPSSAITGINGVQFYASLDGVIYTPIPGAPTAFAAVPTPIGPAEVFTFPAVNANYIRMEVLSSHGDTIVGFSEIAFSGSNTLSLPQTNTTSLKVYPNPTQDYVYIKGLETSKTYEIYDILGSIVRTGSISNGQAIDISQLKSAIYMLKIGTADPIRIIKK